VTSVGRFVRCCHIGRETLVLMVALAAATRPATAQEPRPALVERKLADLGELYYCPTGAPGDTGELRRWERGSLLINADGSRIAYDAWFKLAKKRRQVCVVCNGVRGKIYTVNDLEGLGGTIFFSPDGTRLAYTGKIKDRYFWVYDTKECLDAWELTFSPDSRHVAYVRRPPEEKMEYMMQDGKCVGNYPTILKPVFSPDSKHLAYAASDLPADPRTAGRFIVYDGRKGPVSEMGGATHYPVFSPDSKHVAYTALRGPFEHVICDDKQIGPYGDVNFRLVFAPNSRRLAFAATRQGKWGVECDGVKRVECDEMGEIVFSPDSRRVAYQARVGKDWTVICEGTKPQPFTAVGKPVFSSDSRRVAYAGNRGGHVGSSHFAGDPGADLDGGEDFVVWDGRVYGPHVKTATPLLSPDGTHMIYFARDDTGSAFICEGIRTPAFAFPLTRYSAWGTFSPDSRHLAYLIRHPLTDTQAMVIDGLEGPPHLEVLIPKKWDAAPGGLRYVAVEKDRAWLVEVDWPAGRTWEDAFKPAGK